MPAKRRLGSACHTRREIFDLFDGVMGQQKLAEPPQVEPAMASAAQCAIVEIEAVDIDVCCYAGLQTCRSRPKAASRPTAEAIGGICR
jgi:hypothetical protein